MNEYITLALFIVLFGMAIAALAWKVGQSHGYHDGYLAGQSDARGIWLPKVMKAKVDGAHIGRITELRRQVDSAARQNLN